LNWYKIKERKKKKEKSRHRAAFLLCPEKYLPLPTSRRDDGYISIFILTRPGENRGIFHRFWCSFVAIGKAKNRQPAINQRFERLNHV
jgi:hypothetical protein